MPSYLGRHVNDSQAPCAQCVGPSMLPTLQPRGDVLLHEKATVMLQRVRVGVTRRPAVELSLRLMMHMSKCPWTDANPSA